MRRIASAIAATAVIALPAAGAARGDDPAPAPEALEAVEAAQEALAAGSPAAPAEPSHELGELAMALPELEGAERAEARAVLARPPSNPPTPPGHNGSDISLGAAWTQEETESAQTYDSPGGSFRVHYVTVGRHAPPEAAGGGVPGVPDYVEQVAARADASEQRLNDELGWPAAKPDEGRGGDNRTDIYLSDICAAPGEPGFGCLFGYATPDPQGGECAEPPFRCFGYLVLDDDYRQPEFGYADPDVPLSVTTAHEYAHILHFRLDASQDLWLFESTAVWAEEQVFPDANDWLFFARPWARTPDQPITDEGAAGGLKVYGTAVWNHWLDQGAGYGPDVVLRTWQRSRDSQPKSFAPGAYDLAIRSMGRLNFAREFGRFAAATAEWQVNDDDFADEARLPPVTRRGTLAPGAGARAFALDHTSYRLLRVRTDGRSKVRLRVRVRRGVRAAVALVGRNGRWHTGRVATRLRFLPRGGRAAVALRGAGRFERITAVVANADARVRGVRRGDWNYTRDNATFSASLAPR